MAEPSAPFRPFAQLAVEGELSLHGPEGSFRFEASDGGFCIDLPGLRSTRHLRRLWTSLGADARLLGDADILIEVRGVLVARVGDNANVWGRLARLPGTRLLLAGVLRAILASGRSHRAL